MSWLETHRVHNVVVAPAAVLAVVARGGGVEAGVAVGVLGALLTREMREKSEESRPNLVNGQRPNGQQGHASKDALGGGKEDGGELRKRWVKFDETTHEKSGTFGKPDTARPPLRVFASPPLCRVWLFVGDGRCVARGSARFLARKFHCT